MGCKGSKSQAPATGNGGAGEGGQPLSTKEIQERIEAPAKSESIAIADYRMRYAYISQRGFYPDDRDKANQDSYCVITAFDGDENKALFTVFDGHGKEGDLCAIFCRDHLARNISQELRATKTVEAGLTQSFKNTNEQLHADAHVDDSLSGTTAVAAYLEGRDMWVANVGDSRAILCQEHEGRLVAKPLSSDQTPYRKDERERVKACGARVMSMDQIEGLEPIHENWGDVNLGEELDEGGDPPRIWSPFGEYPGTAFTRSMGDVIAEELGVSADPEIIHRKIHVGDRFIVIASDGVFEFLTNQSVVDMVARYQDPLEACKKVVQEAYDLWLQYEVRTDDITIIVIFLEGVTVDAPAGPDLGPERDLDNIALEGLRPVRREMSRQRQRQFIMHHENFPRSPTNSPRSRDLEDEAYKVEEHIVDKSEGEKARILSAIASNFLFDHITDQQRQVLLDVMVKVPVKAGDWVIRQGERGDRFYIIDEGKFEVRVNQDVDTVTDAKDAGILVHVYEPTETLKPCFGHLALLYSKPRSASVIASTDGVLFALDRPVFRKILVKRSRREVAKTLRQVEVLHSLTLVQLQQLCDVLTEATFEPGEYIIRQGEVGDVFYVIEEGTALVTISSDEGEVGGDADGAGAEGGGEDGGKGSKEKQVRRMREYDYFGERALLTAEPRSANVIAERQVKCLQLSQHAFEEVLGPLSGLIDEDRKRREDKLGITQLEDLRLLGVVLEDELGRTNLCKLPNSNSTYSLRTMWKSEVMSRQQRFSILKAAEIMRHIAEAPAMRAAAAAGGGGGAGGACVSVPRLVGTYSSPNGLHTLHQVAIVGTLSSLLEERGPLGPEAVRHLAACIVLGLEALHKCSVLYRALSPELVMLDNRGYALLTEFQLAKMGLEPTFTLCGHPEYLSPEQVRHQGHSKPVDFWGLGILIYELSHGGSPFAADSEMDIYNRVSAHKAGDLVHPTSFAPAMCDLLDRLLHPDPNERLGARPGDLAALKSHQWFAGFDWGGVGKGECFHQELRQLAHERVQRAVRAEGELDDREKAYTGDQAIWERF